jgi:hypothetical protein
MRGNAPVGSFVPIRPSRTEARHCAFWRWRSAPILPSEPYYGPSVLDRAVCSRIRSPNRDDVFS